MTGFEIATLAVSAVQATASLGAVTAILVGLRRMDQANRARVAEAEARSAETEAREKREDARHAETMRALNALIHGMETVIERTGSRA